MSMASQGDLDVIKKLIKFVDLNQFFWTLIIKNAENNSYLGLC